MGKTVVHVSEPRINSAAGAVVARLRRPGSQQFGDVIIRDATGEDVAKVVELWREFVAEVPDPAWRDDQADIHLRELERALGTDVRATVDRLRAQGRDMLELEVHASNERARSVYEHWGFAPVELTLATQIETLVERLTGANHHR